MIKTQSPLWTSSAAAQATGGEVIHDWQATGVSINTRTLQPGDLFIALQGPNVDGHDYVANAFEKGAAAACVAHRPPVLDPDAPLLVVNDTMAALEDLGRAARARASNAKFIGVTGSVGKTSTKEALKLVLGNQGKTSASEGSLNNQWGLPLSLSRVRGDADFAVLEMGMNHPGELTPLSHMVQPHVCLVTTIAPAHTEFFDSTAQIADAKAEIFEGAVDGWTAVLNADVAEFEQLRQAAQAKNAGEILTFGQHVHADFRVIAYELDASGSLVTMRTPTGGLTYRVGAPGLHWVMNSLAILATVHAVGGDVAQAAETLAQLSAPKGRGERFELSLDDGDYTLIDESYNASPAALRASLAVLAAQTPGNYKGGEGKRIAVLGDMLELGDDTVREHIELAPVLEAADVDQVFLVGEAMGHLWDVLPEHMRGQHAQTSDQILDQVMQAIRPGDVVMVKGSAGSRMGHIVDVLKTAHKGKG